MAIVSIQQNVLDTYDGQEVIVVPKPKKYQRRVIVEVPDQVVLEKQIQPVLDAYAIKVGKPEWVGKDGDWYKKEQRLMLGFHVDESSIGKQSAFILDTEESNESLQEKISKNLSKIGGK